MKKKTQCDFTFQNAHGLPTLINTILSSIPPKDQAEGGTSIFYILAFFGLDAFIWLQKQSPASFYFQMCGELQRKFLTGYIGKNLAGKFSRTFSYTT